MSATTSSAGRLALGPKRVVNRKISDELEIVLPLLATIAVTAAAWAFTPLSGSFGYFIVTFALFLVGVYVVARRAHGKIVGSDRVVTVAIASAGLLTVGPLILILIFVTAKGIGGISAGFFTKTLEGLSPDAAATAGGAKHAIIGTLMQVGVASFVAVPFGVLTAVYLHEINGRLAPAIRVIVDAMSGLPSIVAGLFVYAIFVVGRGYSGLAAALALSILMLPTVARTSEEMLKLVDPGLRESSLALGAPQWRTVMQVVLPTARTGIVTAIILGIARIAGETAPLLMTAFGNDQVVTVDGVSKPQSSLPLFIYQQITNSNRSTVTRGWVGAFVLILLVLTLFTIARIIGRPRKMR